MIEQKAEKNIYKSPTTIYEVEKELGFGAQGRVYLCNTKVKVAIKKITDEYSAEPYFCEKLIASSQNFLHVVKVFEVFKDEEDNNYYNIAMEYCNGLSLQQLLDRRRMFTQEESVSIVYQIAKGIKELLSIGYIHRDIKPANIVSHQLGQDTVYKICDFGIVTKERVAKTQMIGTMLYMAPETLNPTEEYSYDSKVDVWSLGIIFYELLTGKLLYKEKGNHMIRLKILGEVPEIILPEGTDKNVQKLIEQMIKKDPNKRLSISEVISGLEQIINRDEKNQQPFPKPTLYDLYIEQISKKHEHLEQFSNNQSFMQLLQQINKNFECFLQDEQIEIIGHIAEKCRQNLLEQKLSQRIKWFDNKINCLEDDLKELERIDDKAQIIIKHYKTKIGNLKFSFKKQQKRYIDNYRQRSLQFLDRIVLGTDLENQIDGISKHLKRYIEATKQLLKSNKAPDELYYQDIGKDNSRKLQSEEMLLSKQKKSQKAQPLKTQITHFQVSSGEIVRDYDRTQIMTIMYPWIKQNPQKTSKLVRVKYITQDSNKDFECSTQDLSRVNVEQEYGLNLQQHNSGKMFNEKQIKDINKGVFLESKPETESKPTLLSTVQLKKDFQLQMGDGKTGQTPSLLQLSKKGAIPSSISPVSIINNLELPQRSQKITIGQELESITKQGCHLPKVQDQLNQKKNELLVLQETQEDRYKQQIERQLQISGVETTTARLKQYGEEIEEQSMEEQSLLKWHQSILQEITNQSNKLIRYGRQKVILLENLNKPLEIINNSLFEVQNKLQKEYESKLQDYNTLKRNNEQQHADINSIQAKKSILERFICSLQKQY